jgi:hypothetical protein
LGFGERDYGGGIIEIGRKLSEVCGKFVILGQMKTFEIPQRFVSEKRGKILSF